MHFKTKPDTNRLRKSPARNNVLNYSVSTTVGYFKQTPQKQLMLFFFRAVTILYGSCSSLVSNMKLIFTERSTVVRFPLQIWTFYLRHNILSGSPSSQLLDWYCGKGAENRSLLTSVKWQVFECVELCFQFRKNSWHVATSNLDFNTISYFANVCNSCLLPLNYSPYICSYAIQCISFLPLLDYRTST